MTNEAPPGASQGRALLFRLVAEEVRPHAAALAAAVAAMVVAAAATAALAWLLDPALRYIFEDKRIDMLVAIPLAVAGVAVGGALAAYFAGARLASIGQAVVARLQGRMFAKLTASDLALVDQAHSGAHLSRLVYDATLVRDMVARGLTGLVRDTLTILLLLGLMIWLDWTLALLTFVALPLIAAAMRRFGRRASTAADAGMAETGALSTLIGEAVQGRRIVKAYALEATMNARADASIARRLTALVRGERANAATIPVSDALGGIGVAIVLAYAGWRGIQGELPLSEFVSFIAAALMAFQPMRALSSLTTVFAQGTAALARVYDFLDAPDRVVDRPGADELSLDGAGDPLIAFEDAAFAYPGRDVQALRGLTLRVRRGERVALVGPSGSGKSTVFNLILRFYDVDSGAARVGGRDVREVSIESLRRRIALVAQEPFLFDDTIEANVACAKPGATRAEVEAAARAADAHAFIEALPEGYATRVGEGGSRLSGGQRQRIAIARAVLKDAPILLLDEATSALDAQSERAVQDALDRLSKGRTTLVIAHRLSTVMGADRIVAMEGGRIVEEGRHAELLAKGGLYARLHATQFAAETAGAET